VGSSPRHIALRRERETQALGKALHGVCLVGGDCATAVVTPSRALQELGEQDPLCADLDGTLIRMDVMVECLPFLGQL
jgi:hypothetical protein